MYMYIHNISTCFYVQGVSVPTHWCTSFQGTFDSRQDCTCSDCTVDSHKFNLLSFNLRVSNPRTVAYLHFEMPLESSDLPGAGPIFPD